MLRLAASTRKMWQSCTEALHLSGEVIAVSDITLQLVLKRIMQSIIHQLTVENQARSNSPAGAEISLDDCNVIRYIAGYVVLKMKKKFPHHSSFFDNIVITTYDYISVSTVDEYSRLWVEQVDRGGLCNVSEDFYALLKEIECVCRHYLDVRVVPSEKVTENISKDVFACAVVSSLWHKITSMQSDSTHDILKAIIKLWTNVRVHSFTKQWSDILQQKAANHEKALRKTLKRKCTDKDSTS